MTGDSQPVGSAGASFVRRLNDLVHEGNVRHLVVSRNESTVVDLPLTAVAIGTVLAPWLAVVGVVAALATDSKLQLINTEAAKTEGPPAPTGPGAGERSEEQLREDAAADGSSA